MTPTGDIVDVGARLQKCSTGLALEQLFAGSEGTLGIITEITVKLRPLPPYSFNMVCVFKTDEEAFALPNKILKAGVDPTSLEYMDNEAIIMTEKYLDMHFPHADEPKKMDPSMNLKLTSASGNCARNLPKRPGPLIRCSRPRTLWFLSTKLAI